MTKKRLVLGLPLIFVNSFAIDIMLLTVNLD